MPWIHGDDPIIPTFIAAIATGNWFATTTAKYARELVSIEATKSKPLSNSVRFCISIQNCSLTQQIIQLHCKEHVWGNSYNLWVILAWGNASNYMKIATHQMKISAMTLI